MRLGGRACKAYLIVAGCLLLTLPPLHAQKPPAANSAESARAVLADKARALESRGRPDMAIQLWQQILLSAPENTEALAGLARDYKLTGSNDQANQTLDRLRRVSPNDPNIARIESMVSTSTASEQLRQAGELARRGRNNEAMRIYRQLYGDQPPNGDIALAYYETLFGSSGGRPAAIAGMRALVDRNPGDPRYAVALGTMLTYDPHTRAEGIRILHAHPNDSAAQSALRQALVWDSANPASAAELRDYLKSHPQDTDVATRLRQNESKLAQMNSGIARNPAERAAFQALNARRLDEAERRFTDLLRTEPNNGRVEAGMAFLRMRQQNFGGAINYFILAEQHGYKVKIVEDGLASSRFWFAMSEAAQAFNQNQLEVSAVKYHDALALNPRSSAALNGLAGVYVKTGQFAAATQVYEQLVRLEPRSLDGWRGLFLASARANQYDRALAVAARIPPPVRTALNKDPEFLRTLAAVDQARGQTADAERVLALALALPFPVNSGSLRADTRMQYAGILMQASRFSQAAALYAQAVADDPSNGSAWMGLISAHHEMGQDAQAGADVERIPPATYDKILGDSGFLSVLAAVDQANNQLDVAQSILERAASLDAAAGRQPSTALQLQLAGIYLARNNPGQALSIYQQILAANSESVGAWKGFIAALVATSRSSEAMQDLARIPASVRRQLESDIGFLQTEAGLYVTAGDTARAIGLMNRVQAYYARLRQPPPPAVDIQNAWLLYSTGNDRALYPALMRIGGRTDLTVAQRETVQNIWANWSVRRAAAAMDDGNAQHAVDILDAASQAFPNNLAVRKAVAGGYARVGRAKESLALYKTIPMQDATAGDFEGAVGAALAANDKSQAELWLRQALERYPTDPTILSLAGRYEEARGDNERAADYFRAALAAMPSVSPADRLAHELVYPEQDLKAHRAVTAADLQHLLDPDYEPFAKTTKLPPAPPYGPDPYTGQSPAVFPPAQPASQTPAGASPGAHDLPLPPPVPRSCLDSSPLDASPSMRSVRLGAEPRNTFYERDGAALGLHATVSGRALKGHDFSRAGYSGKTNRASAPEGGLRLARPQRELRPAPRLVLASWTMPRRRYGVSPSALRFGLARHPALQAATEPSGPPELSLDPPHTLASDAWKGLVFSLIAANRNAEALQELNKIPPATRRILESDVAWVQGIAGLYVAVGDVPRANQYVKRVESFYLLHRGQAPASLDVQHAWLLYNINDDAGLYPVLTRLDARTDLTDDERQRVQALWGDWAIRRANQAISSGHLLRGVEILQAASHDYPDNTAIRFAAAGAYIRIGRTQEALALYKSIPMANAASADYQGAIGAALSARDLAQAEIWLRVSLGRFPRDPGILSLAAHFEQARGNKQRAAEFWRAALAAIPPGSSVPGLPGAPPVPPGSYGTPAPGDSRRLLDPRLDARPANEELAPLPSYKPGAPAQSPYTQALPPEAPAPPPTAPSANPLPFPSESANPAYMPQGQGTAPSNAPVFVDQANARPAPIQPSSASSSGALPPPRSGRIMLPSSEENVESAGPAEPPPHVNAAKRHPQPQASNRHSTPPAALRIAPRPMNPVAAQAQAGFAEETDSQLTQGSSALIHPVSNAPVTPAPAVPSAPPLVAPPVAEQPAPLPIAAAPIVYDVAQNSPSPEQAASGAFSAPQQPQSPSAPPAAAPQTAPPAAPPTPPAKPRAGTAAHRRRPAAHHAQPAPQQPVQTLANAPVEAPPAESTSPAPAAETLPPLEPRQPAESPQPTPPASVTGLSDEQLEQRNLPPLRGPWIRIQRQSNPLSPRELAEQQLQAIESGYSGWLGGTSLVNYRSGAPGYDQLAAIESPFEASTPLGVDARLTAVAIPVFLDSGQATGAADLTVSESESSRTCLVTIPEPIGTYVAGQNFTPCSAPTIGAFIPPAQQNAFGLGGELQLAFPHILFAGGYTPAEFLVSTFTARFKWQPANGPITISLLREPEKDSQLSYAGLRDPAGNTLSTQGQIWGGVISNQGLIQVSHGDAESGFYFAAGGQYLTGVNVVKNNRVDATGGAYWRALASPEYGNLTVGANFFAMHYANNQNAFTHGMGGYFSPQVYFLGNVPFTWTGHYQTRFHYNVVGAVGAQAFQQDATPLFPLPGDKPLETSQNNPMLPALTSVSANYDLRGQAAYQIGRHWFAGAYFAANNTRNYTFSSAGFFVRFLFREQPPTATAPTGLFPAVGPRPFTVP